MTTGCQSSPAFQNGCLARQIQSPGAKFRIPTGNLGRFNAIISDRSILVKAYLNTACFVMTKGNYLTAFFLEGIIVWEAVRRE